ncbi:Fe3+ transporter ferrichrome-binding periplasmic protein [Acetobacter nitrogenifigens DSM 23921 = NBRC 105050]|uniref:ABC transporter substrate-binding protein n=1 Tax=Acetobacter nitrogenifigens DSM 23921 = NBRC 105050 TaxID=1120919 RepID=A0A511XAR1_9PROT|nr:ABC transporter substrate-binding protein [Acetobacter nitrogenifigens]GBQ90952.1 Fe3+ transporter ferrichrome-binding periplasmic protein [Acetobacter nitrogenifigens DSM 23921 = NBRC 105050]GEN60044.1 ABC transporter substrate-binding protein [Acetobacter nitrogenifigens DSM 23921 = NBRC 105050]
MSLGNVVRSSTFTPRKSLRVYSVGAGILLALIGAGLKQGVCAPSSHGAILVSDMQGEKVSTPAHPVRIADLWFAHNEVVAMLGAADRVAVTVDKPANQPWLFQVSPALKAARFVTPGSADVEGLLADKVDLVFVSTGLTDVSKLREAGLPTLDMSFRDMAGLRRSVELTAAALNDVTAREKAARYNAALDTQLVELDTALAAAPAATRPKVLHLKSLFPLMADGRDTIIDQWITRAGGRNAAGEVSGNMRPVDMEQIQVWDPDVIIVQGGVPLPAAGTPAPAGWDVLRAVRNGKVFMNPTGVFPWDRYGSEVLLQLRWVAKLLHPDLFGKYDLPADSKKFYQDYFGVSMTPGQIDRILTSRPPAD